MTCIVGWIENKEVFIGGDSAGVAGFDRVMRKDSKVFVKKDMVFGFTSSFRMGQIIRYVFNIPKQGSKQGIYNYMCSTFIDGLMECFTKKKYARVDNNVATGGCFLVGYKGHLYKISPDFQVGESRDQYDACGCGEDYALGALRATTQLKMSPKNRIRHVLSASEYFSCGVKRPFSIVSVK